MFVLKGQANNVIFSFLVGRQGPHNKLNHFFICTFTRLPARESVAGPGSICEIYLPDSHIGPSNPLPCSISLEVLQGPYTKQRTDRQ